VTQYRADHAKQRGLFDADLARNAELVRDADAAVLVWDANDWRVRDLLVRCKARGLPVRVLGVRGDPLPENAPRRGLPD
jgi:hypothetical protein